MLFEWNENKNKANQKKHGISFEEAALIFKGEVLTHFDDNEDYGEEREMSIGLIGAHVVVVVVHTDRQNVTRIISARLANRSERKAYDDYYKKTTR
ncbi:MAG: hypothetical protein CSA09_04355 [Candidatus Contendobacter odensis]|uniref:BrnT family toxin n=1 Tax=Candidatus Contendibacter odensensis TaxID=1400860 RepID=A0A2G6PEF8_9GAMM|nr:MAG: hypothetical protein CSA09_04355 [Candidatus Contendobacter odensis]